MTITTPEQMREAAAKEVLRIGLEIGVTGVPVVMLAAVNAIRATAPQPVAVTVKPLVWGKQQSHAGDSYWRSDFGHEILATATDTFAEMETGKRFNFSSDAIKFVQTTHEASILSALTIHPADPLSDPRVVALVEAAQALGAMPEGYCFCSKDRIGDASKIHEPECRDLRAALRAIGGEA